MSDIGPMSKEISELEAFIASSRIRKDLPATVLDAVSVRLADLLDEREKIISSTPASRHYVQRMREYDSLKSFFDESTQFSPEFKDSIMTQATRICESAERIVELELKRL